MKKIVILCISMLILSACEDILEVKPQTAIEADTALDTHQEVESSVIGIYSTLGRGSLYGCNLLLLPELLAAEGNLRWRGTFQSFREVGAKSMVAENTEASRTWINAYDGINLANIVLSALDIVKDESQRKVLEGEAKVARAILHFELVRLYAKAWNDGDPNTNLGVPVRTKAVLTEADASQPTARNTVAEVYTRIIADLQDAISLLPEQNGVRFNTYAASAFLARVYLQQGNYPAAVAQANRVIESGKYRLNTAVTGSFVDGENTAESIFEIQQNDQNNAGTGNDGMATFYATLVGIGRGDIQVLSYYNNDPEDYVFLDRVTTFDLYDEDDRRLNELFYTGPEGSRRPGRLTSLKWNNYSQNLPIIRLAEMYLIRAECNLREGTSIGASPLTDINIVRSRAGIAELVSVSLADILLERRLELAFEGSRIHDVKRLEETLQGWTFSDDDNTYVPGDAYEWNDQYLIFPIPQREIDANSGLKNQQNNGY